MKIKTSPPALSTGEGALAQYAVRLQSATPLSCGEGLGERFKDKAT